MSDREFDVFTTLRSGDTGAVARAVEARHYPELPAPRPQPVAEAAWAAVRLALVALLLNVLVLPLYFVTQWLGVFDTYAGLLLPPYAVVQGDTSTAVNRTRSNTFGMMRVRTQRHVNSRWIKSPNGLTQSQAPSVSFLSTDDFSASKTYSWAFSNVVLTVSQILGSPLTMRQYHHSPPQV